MWFNFNLLPLFEIEVFYPLEEIPGWVFIIIASCESWVVAL